MYWEKYFNEIRQIRSENIILSHDKKLNCTNADDGLLEENCGWQFFACQSQLYDVYTYFVLRKGYYKNRVNIVGKG